MHRLNHKQVNLFELLICFVNAGDLISPGFADHQQKVAYLSFKIAEQLNLPKNQQKDLIMAGLLHDVGDLFLNEKYRCIGDCTQEYAIKGAKIFEGFPPLFDVADIIRYHHVSWDNGEGKVVNGKQVPLSSHIIHIADEIVNSIDPRYNIIGQITDIQNKILSKNNITFAPEYVEAFINISGHEYIWLDIADKPMLNIMSSILSFGIIDLDFEEISALSKIIASIIDFRSPFTANHSAGVAKTAEKLAELAGFSKNESMMMLVAGYLHDLGKLALKNELLEKPSKLSVNEFNEIRSHTFYTYRLLQPIKGFETINIWASLHHEKLNGKGYPFNLTADSIPLGSRIMAVADVFTAITENRPYRKGMTNSQVVTLLNSMVKDQSISPYVVSILIENFDLINDIRKKAQCKAINEYNQFIELKITNNNQLVSNRCINI